MEIANQFKRSRLTIHDRSSLPIYHSPFTIHLRFPIRENSYLRTAIYHLLLVQLASRTHIPSPATPTLKTTFENGSDMTDQKSVSDSKPETQQESNRGLIAEYEARLDEVADLVARVRHEINNPLAGVLGQAQLLLREELNDRARKRAQTIEELAIRLRDVVAQLRQIQRPANSGAQEPE